MKKKQSLREVVLAVIREQGPIKPKEIIAKTKRPAAQVYTVLHKLFKETTLDKTQEGGYFYIGDVTKTLPARHEVTQKPEKSPVLLEKKLAEAYAEIDNLQKQVHDLTIKYLDTSAVLKYLESKLNLSVK